MLLYGLYLIFQRYNPGKLAFIDGVTVSRSTQPIKLAYPQKITIASADISVPIIPIKITKNSWVTTNKGVALLTSSPLPGQRGNSVLYGHNWSNILGNLYKTRIGDEVLVDYPDGTKIPFEVAFISVVTPDQSHIIGPSSDTRITIYTCAGMFDEKRLVVTAIAKSSFPLFSMKSSVTSR